MVPENGTSVRAGNYAVTTSKIRPWLSTPVTAAPAKSRRSKTSPIILNPLFEECANLTTDPYWTSIFHQAALGKFPRGFLYKDVYLTYKRGAKITRLEIPTVPVEALSACISFFTKTAGLMSTADQERARQEFEERMADTLSIHSCRWDQIKKKVRDILIGTFVQEVAESLKLSENEENQLSTTIHLGFFLGYFQNKHVNYENGRIRSIGGLNQDPQTKIFSIDPSFVPKVAKSSKSKSQCKPDDHPKDKQSFLFLWLKFLEKFEKKAILSLQAPLQIINTPPTIADVSDITGTSTSDHQAGSGSPVYSSDHLDSE